MNLLEAVVWLRPLQGSASSFRGEHDVGRSMGSVDAFSAMDTNGDGVISRQEWDAAKGWSNVSEIRNYGIWAAWIMRHVLTLSFVSHRFGSLEKSRRMCVCFSPQDATSPQSEVHHISPSAHFTIDWPQNCELSYSWSIYSYQRGLAHAAKWPLVPYGFHSQLTFVEETKQSSYADRTWVNDVYMEWRTGARCWG